MMTMVTPIVRRAGEGKYPVVTGVVAVDIVSGGASDNRRGNAQVTDQRGGADIDHVIPEPAAVGPPAGNRAASESAHKGVAAEDAKPRESGFVIRAATGQAGRRSRQVYFDQVGNEDAHDVAPPGDRGSRQRAIEHDGIDQSRGFGI